MPPFPVAFGKLTPSTVNERLQFGVGQFIQVTGVHTSSSNAAICVVQPLMCLTRARDIESGILIGVGPGLRGPLPAALLLLSLDLVQLAQGSGKNLSATSERTITSQVVQVFKGESPELFALQVGRFGSSAT
jgi:hypothetical protein